MTIEAARFNTIGQRIRAWNAFDPGVLAVLDEAGREDGVPEAYRAGIATKRAGAARRVRRASGEASGAESPFETWAAALVNVPRPGQSVFSVR
ncbi:MAG: hypothetical protein LBQ62_08900 [Candidatus Accumulibacter sp.]|nr:hypothetical protein [Accumulibacter sp.]